MNRKYQNIQLLRIISCMGVFAVHFGQRLEIGGKVGELLNFGRYGVNLFFIICGFVAFLSLDNKKFDIKKYYYSRFIRIAPVYYVVIIYQFILHTFILKDVPIDVYNLEWKRYFLWLNVIIPSEVNFWNNLGAMWTIFTFMLFYLLVPLIRKIAKNFYSSIFVWLFFYVLQFILDFSSLTTIKNIHYIMLGVVVFYAVKEKRERIFMLLSIAYFIYYRIFSITLGSLELTLLFSFLLILTIDIKIENTFISKIINILDEHTYAVYLIHAVFIEIIDIYKLYFYTNHWKIAAVIIGIFGTGIFSIVIHNFIEKPLQNKLKDKLII